MDSKSECNIWSKEFACSSYVANDIRSHNTDKSHECHLCGKRYTKACALYVHKQNTHVKDADKQYQCNTCHKRFAFKSMLISHAYIHSEQKAFQCDLCKKCFSRACYVDVHKKQVHSAKTPEDLPRVPNLQEAIQVSVRVE